jgi:hypothetical protein
MAMAVAVINTWKRLSVAFRTPHRIRRAEAA